MSYSGDAAEQIVRMSLAGVDVAARITGTAAKEIALMLIAALRSQNSTLKPKGRARLISMLKSGKALEIFSVKESDLKKFQQGAKQYGIVYCVLRNTKNSPDGLCDIMVKADDAPKISRLVERFRFATVDRAALESELVAEIAERATMAEQGTEPNAPDVGDTERLLDELLGGDEGRAGPQQADTAPAAPHQPGREPSADAPFFGSGPPTSPQSATISGSRRMPGKTILDRPSVKEELREISAAKKGKETESLSQPERSIDDKTRKPLAATTHTQPKRGKTKKAKGNR